jgi:hypothetical protein
MPAGDWDESSAPHLGQVLVSVIGVLLQLSLAAFSDGNGRKRNKAFQSFL